jgi:hypothetical protein
MEESVWLGGAGGRSVRIGGEGDGGIDFVFDGFDLFGGGVNEWGEAAPVESGHGFAQGVSATGPEFEPAFGVLGVAVDGDIDPARAHTGDGDLVVIEIIAGDGVEAFFADARPAAGVEVGFEHAAGDEVLRVMFLEGDDVIAVVDGAVGRRVEDTESTGVEEGQRLDVFAGPQPQTAPDRARFILDVDGGIGLGIGERGAAKASEDIVETPVAELPVSSLDREPLVFRREVGRGREGLVDGTHIHRASGKNEPENEVWTDLCRAHWSKSFIAAFLAIRGPVVRRGDGCGGILNQSSIDGGREPERVNVFERCRVESENAHKG